MSITVESFTLEPGASIADDDTIKNIFIEYQFLNFDNEELETPLSLPLPQEGETVEFNFRKGNTASTCMGLAVGYCSSPSTFFP